MKKVSILSIALALSATSAFADTYEYRLPNDASDLKVVSAKLDKVVSGSTFVPDESEEGYPGTTVYQFAPGLRLTVYYKAYQAFEDSDSDSTTFDNEGTQEFDIVGAKGLVSATLTHHDVQETRVDNSKSTYCDIDENEEKVDPSCQDHEVTYNVTVTAAFLTVITQ